MNKQRKKNIGLLAGIIVFAFLSWKLSIAKTFALKNEIETMKVNISELPDENMLHRLKAEKKWLDSLISKNDHSNIHIQNSILDVIDEANKNTSLKLMSFSEPFTNFSKDSIQSVSFHFEIQGSYRSLEEILYNLEKSALGQIKSFKISKNKNYSTGKEYLQASYILTYKRALRIK